MENNLKEFDLKLLIYGINYPNSLRDKVNTQLKLINRFNNFSMKTVVLLDDNVIIKNNNSIISLSEFELSYKNINKYSIKNKPTFLLHIFYKIHVLIHNINSADELVGLDYFLHTINDSRTLKKLLVDKNNLFRFLNKDDPEFHNIKHFIRYILFTLESMAKDDKTLSFYETYFNNFENINFAKNSDIIYFKNMFTSVGFTVTSTEPKLDNYYGRIVFVAELDNWRYFIISKEEKNTDYIHFGLIHYSNKLYNYIDADRVMAITGSSLIRFNIVYNEINPALSFEDIRIVNNYYQDVKNDELIVITKEKSLELLNAHIRYNQYKAKTSDITKALLSKIDYKISKLSTNGTPFKINDVEYGLNYIKYDSQEIKLISPTNTKLVVNSLKNIFTEVKDSKHKYRVSNLPSSYTYRSAYLDYIESSRVTNINDISFDNMYDEFICSIFNEYLYFKRSVYDNNKIADFTIQLGDVLVEFTAVTSINTVGVKSTLLYINNYKITKNDIYYCIHSAISYNNTEEYNKFLESISYTSLKVHKLVQQGLIIDFFDTLTNDYVYLLIPVKRVKNRNYLIINDKSRRIKDTNAILRLSKSNSIEQIFNTLINPDKVENIKYNDIIGILQKAKTAYNNKKQTSEQMLKDTLKALNIELKQTVVIDTGQTLEQVYEVKGNLRTYYIEKSEPFKIISKEDGKYICMLDKSPFVAPEVKLINRLYALKNDSVIARSVATLNF